MILPIVRYGHPALRQKGARVEAITPEVRQLITDLLDTMYAAHGIGLAAQQVGRPLQVAVLDVRGIEDRPSSLEIDGQPSAVEAMMPLVLLNPRIRPLADPVEGPEGCLSFPEIFAPVSRPAAIEVEALGTDGRPLAFRCGGLLARAIQHEVDHLNGILYIDRMDSQTRKSFQPDLEALMADTKSALEAERQRTMIKGGA